MEIRLENVQTDYFKVSSFSLSAGKKLLIQGPSGSGKTTFLHLLAGLYRPSSGVVSWDGKSSAEYSEHALAELRRTRMGLIFQNLNLLSYLTAAENIELGGASASAARELLSTVGLSDKAAKRTQNLSLGEQQRVAVARVLAQKAEVLLADEPTSSLDDKNADQVMKLLLNSGGGGKQSLIMVSHDHRIEKFFDQVISAEELLR